MVMVMVLDLGSRGEGKLYVEGANAPPKITKTVIPIKILLYMHP